MRILLIVSLFLAGCAGIDLRDNLSDAGTATATIGCSILTGGNVPACSVVGFGTGVTINTVTGAEGIDVSQVTNVHQEEVAKAQVKADLFESLGREVIIGGGIIFLLWTWLTWFIGARRARPEEYRAATERDVYKRMAEERHGR